MSATWLLILLLALSALGFILGRSRAMASAVGDSRLLHSLPKYYGLNVVMTALAPAMLLLVAWVLIQPMVAQNRAAALIPEGTYADSGALNLMMSDVRRIAGGLDAAVGQGRLTPEAARDIGADADIRALLGEAGVALGSEVDPAVLAAAQRYRAVTATGRLWMAIAVLALAAVGFAVSFQRTDKDLRARNLVERGMLALLIAASGASRKASSIAQNPGCFADAHSNRFVGAATRPRSATAVASTKASAFDRRQCRLPQISSMTQKPRCLADALL